MPYYPTIPDTYQTQQVTDVFRGLNHKLKIGDGEFSDMENLTSDHYPLLANRKKRSIVLDIPDPQGLLGKDRLVYVDGDKLYYGDEELTDYLKDKGCVISEAPEMLPEERTPAKTLVSMGAYVLIFPDKLYINTQDFTDCGSMEHVFSTGGQNVQYRMCRPDGTEYEAPTLGDQMPENPENGALWVDPYAETKTLKQYNESTDTWEPIPTVYTKISCPGIHEGFKQYDGVRISGCAAGADIENRNQIEALNGSKIIYGLGDNYIIVVGLLDMPVTQLSGSVTVSRKVPDMDFITEAENRLWGCKYGYAEGGPVNEIYCCALGDFKNWEQYLGLATDSWRGSVGTDGGFTGATTHLGHPLFFKEDCLHKVYISSTGAHRVVETQCRGVQAGSHRSLAIVNETLFYKSISDICAYDGTLPVSVSEALGDKRYFGAVAGAYGDKYYISMNDNIGNWEMFVFDTSNSLWHREDDTHAMQFVDSAGILFFLDEHGRVQCVDGFAEGRPENEDDPLPWRAVTGLLGYGTVEQKYISRFNLRMQLPKGSVADIYIEYDSDGVWHHAGHMVGTGTKTFMLPVRPRRCDHFRIKLTGVGDVRVYSFAKIFEAGSDM
jgi:hypothetical protein